jgi:hypothetical protein
MVIAYHRLRLSPKGEGRLFVLLPLAGGERVKNSVFTLLLGKEGLRVGRKCRRANRLESRLSKAHTRHSNLGEGMAEGWVR